MLDRILARRGGGLFLFPLLTSTAFQAVLRLGQADRFSDALAEQFGVQARIVVDQGEQDPRAAGAVLWTVAAEGNAEFRFRQGLAKHGFATMIIDNWLKCLPAYARYLALPAAERSAGRTWLNLEHMGTFPGVAFCDFRPGYQLMMDPRFIATNAYAHIRKQFAAAPVPWEDRRPAALWRGRLTGAVPADAPGVDAPWRSLPRARLCLLARGLGEAVDAGLTQLVSVQDPRRISRDRGGRPAAPAPLLGGLPAIQIPYRHRRLYELLVGALHQALHRRCRAEGRLGLRLPAMVL